MRFHKARIMSRTANDHINYTDADADDSTEYDNENREDVEIEDADPLETLPEDLREALENADETVQAKGYIEKALRDEVKANAGVSMTDAVRDGFLLHVGGGDVAERKIRMLKQQKREIDNEIAERNAEIRKLQNENAAAREQRERIDELIDRIEREHAEQREAYETYLDALADVAENGGTIAPNLFPVRDAASAAGDGVTTSDVIDDLHDRVSSEAAENVSDTRVLVDNVHWMDGWTEPV